MEKNIVAVEENHQQSDSSNVSLPSGSVINNIDSISIDLNVAMEKNKAEECHHFSIRQYVAETRLKDWKICWPFSSNGRLRMSEEKLSLLPPLNVPKFRWWGCQNCLPEVGGTSYQIPPHGNAAMVPSDCQQDENYLSSCSNEKEKNAEVGHIAGCETVAVNSNNSKYAECTASSSNEIHIPEKMNSADDEQVNALKACEPVKEVGKIAETTTVNGKKIRVPSVQLESKYDDTSSERAELIYGIRMQEQHHDNKSRFPRQKMRKVRQLSELLGEKENAENDPRNREGACAGLASLSAPIDQVTMQENAGKVFRVPPRKRKAAQDGYQKPLNNMAKKVRTSNREADTNIMVIEISDSESEEDGSAEHGISSLPKNKNITSKIADGQFSLIPRRDSMFGEGSSINRNDIGPDVSSHRGLDLNLSNCISALRNDKISPMLPPKKSMPSTDAQRKDSTNLVHKPTPTRSLGEDSLHDLNEIIAHRTARLRERQNGTPLAEDTFSLPQNLELSDPYKNEKTLELRGRSEIIKKQDNQRTDKVLDEGMSDEIPMEIVELMAKNQYERRLYEAERNDSLFERTNNNNKNTETMGFPRVHGNGEERPSLKEHPNVSRFPYGSAGNGKNTTAENFGATKNHLFNNLSNVGISHFKVGQLEENPGFVIRDSFHQSQQKLSSGIQLSASGWSRTSNAQNHQWNSDKMIHRTSPTKIPNNETQSSKMHNPAQSPALMDWGNVVRDIDLNTVDPDSACYLEEDGETFDSEDLNQTTAKYKFSPNQKEVEPKSKALVSLDSSSNETIPAMQLLSLIMDGASFKKGQQKFLEKPPCQYHPKFVTDGKENFLDKYFSPLHHSRGLTGLGPGVYNISSNLAHSSSALSGQMSIRSLQKGKGKKSYPPEEASKSTKAVSACVSHSVRDYISGNDKQKGILGASNYMVLPLQHLSPESSTKPMDLEPRNMPGNLWPMNHISKNVICGFNKNPADFSTPGAGNLFMIRGQDLKLGKKKPYKDRSGNVNVDGPKRQRVKSLTAAKDRAQKHTS